MSKPAPVSELIQAATQLEAELDGFAKLTRLVEKEPLTSRRSLERASATLSQVATTDERLGPAMRGLMTALDGLRARHQVQADALAVRAEEVRVRSEAYAGLLDRLSALGARAAELNTALVEVTASEEASRGDLVAKIDAALAKMAEVSEAVASLRRDCREQRFEDVEREVDRLEGQLTGARNKLLKLQRELAR